MKIVIDLSVLDSYIQAENEFTELDNELKQLIALVGQAETVITGEPLALQLANILQRASAIKSDKPSVDQLEQYIKRYADSYAFSVVNRNMAELRQSLQRRLKRLQTTANSELRDVLTTPSNVLKQARDHDSSIDQYVNDIEATVTDAVQACFAEFNQGEGV